MKMLRKIFLYNWHGFFRETIEVNGSFLMTGENGSGKSTLLDALYFLLSGGNDGNFNKAANDDGQRTVESYMRGRTGRMPNPVLRNAPELISHIALEFYDDAECVPLTVGVVLEIQENAAAIGRSFYHLKNTGISDALFFTEDDAGNEVVMNFRSMKKRIDESILKDLSSGKRSEIRSRIYAALSIDDKRYYTLLTSALAFRPIKDVGEFVYRFLMPERDVNIENIRRTIQSYRDLKARISEDEQKKEYLETIIGAGNRLMETQRQILMNNALLHDIGKEKAEADRKKALSTVEESGIRLEDARRKKRMLEKDMEDLSATIRDLENNEALRALRELRITLAHEKEKLSEAEKAESELNRLLMSEDELCMKAGFNPGLGDMIAGREFAKLHGRAEGHSEKIRTMTDGIQRRIFGLVEEEKSLSEKLGRLEEEKKKLSNGVPEYPAQFENLRSAVRKNILAKTGKEAELHPVCERMEIEDPTGVWRNAVEGTLGDRRFDLIIPHEAYGAALEAYLEEKGPRNIYRMGIVDDAEIGIAANPQDVNTDGPAVSGLLVCDDEKVLRHVRACLSGIVCSDEKDLQLHPKAVTASCMRREGDTVYHMSPREYERPYIGIDAIRIQLEDVTRRVAETSARLHEIREKKKEAEEIRNLLAKSRISVILSYDDVWAKCDSCRSHVDELLTREKELVSECGQVVHDIDGYREKKRQKSVEREETDSLITELSNTIAVCTASAQAAAGRAEEERKHFSALISTDSEIRSYEAFRSRTKAGPVQLNEQIVRLEKEFGRTKDLTLKEMTIYIERFGFDATPDLDSLDAFGMEYNTVVTRNLVTYRSKLETAKEEATILFQNAYVAEIRRHIKEERRNIAKLNRVLEDKPFGYDGEVYQFVVSRSDNPDFAEYYDIFTGNEDFNVNDLFTEQLSERNSSLLKDLFDRLTEESPSKDDERKIREYTDYRRFMSYDIRIRNRQGEESYFSKINREKSGGETQTPFYVIIAASFDQISRNGRLGSSGCLVMFDEAFNNMDEAHIDAMMRYFRQLSIQPVISVPTERYRTIFPYVDTAVGMVKVKDRIFPRPFIRETHQ